MANPKHVYELLLDHCSSEAVVDNLMIGLVWTLCKTRDQAGIGLAMSPGHATRTLSWSGSLTGKPITDLAAWILDWNPYQASVAMAAINSCINSRPLPESIALQADPEHANLAVFDYFLPQLHHKKVVVIGRYPGIERYQDLMQLSVLEKQPAATICRIPPANFYCRMRIGYFSPPAPFPIKPFRVWPNWPAMPKPY